MHPKVNQWKETLMIHFGLCTNCNMRRFSHEGNWFNPKWVPCSTVRIFLGRQSNFILDRENQMEVYLRFAWPKFIWIKVRAFLSKWTELMRLKNQIGLPIRTIKITKAKMSLCSWSWFAVSRTSAGRKLCFNIQEICSLQFS